MKNKSFKTTVDIPNRKNMFSLEGIDGSGKTTQRDLISKELNALGYNTVAVASPSSGLLGEFVRNNMKNLQSWERNTIFLMDFIHVLRENSDNSTILLWDRYIDSGYVSNRDMSIDEAIDWLSSLPNATKTYLLDIDPSDVIKTRGESVHDHSADTQWQNFKRQRYLELVERFPERIVMIDANQDPQEITKIIVADILNSLD